MRNSKIALLVIVAFVLMIVAAFLGVRFAAAPDVRIVIITTTPGQTATVAENPTCAAIYATLVKGDNTKHVAMCSTSLAIPTELQQVHTCGTLAVLWPDYRSSYCTGTLTHE